jgi:hypothetical protein
MPIPPLLLLVVTGAAQTPATAPRAHHRWGRTFISPMGEPFHDREAGEDTLADWFSQADRNHDGQLTLDEMKADGDRFFAVLDTNHDGEIDPDEITHYEDVIAPEVRSGPHLDMAGLGGTAQAGDERAGGHRRHRSEGRPYDGGEGGWRGARVNQGYQGAARFGLLDLPEPVASADADFNRGVSLEEFRQAAAQRFAALDVGHRGRLTLAVLEDLRPAPPPVPHKSDDEPAPDTGDSVPAGG